MNLGKAKEIFDKHLKNLIINSKDGDETVKALQILQYHINETIADTTEVDTIDEPTNEDVIEIITNTSYADGKPIRKITEYKYKEGNDLVCQEKQRK